MNRRRVGRAAADPVVPGRSRSAASPQNLDHIQSLGVNTVCTLTPVFLSHGEPPVPPERLHEGGPDARRRGRVQRARGRRATRAGCVSCWTACSTTPAAGTGRSPRCSTRRSRAPYRDWFLPKSFPVRGVRRRAVPRELRVLVGPARPARSSTSTTRASASTSWTSARSGCASSTSTAGVWITRSRSSRRSGNGSATGAARKSAACVTVGELFGVNAGRRRRGRALRLAHELRVRDVRGGVRGRRRGAQAGRRHRRGLPESRPWTRTGSGGRTARCAARTSPRTSRASAATRAAGETRWARARRTPRC